MKKNKILVVVFLFLSWASIAQENNIPVGAWRLHLNYSRIKSLAEVDGTIYGAAENGLMSVDTQDHSTGSLTKLSGLSGVGVSCIANDDQKKIAIIGYEDGTIAFLEGNKVTNVERLKTTAAITGSRSINHLTVAGTTVYAATDFGVVVLSTETKEIRETWRDLGANGETIRIFQSIVLADSIYLATEKGIWAGSRQSNLLDFGNWKKFTSGDLSKGVKTIAAFNNTIYAAVDGSGIFKKQGSSWTKESFLQNLNYTRLTTADAKLFVCADAKLWQVDNQSQVSEINTTELSHPNDVLAKDGILYVADDSQGIFSISVSSRISFVTSGPRLNSFWKIRRESNATYAVGGGYTGGFLPTNTKGIVSSFSTDWSTSTLPVSDITDFDLSDPSKSFFTSFDNGLLESNSQTTWNVTNSALGSNSITAIEKSTEGWWMANFNSAKPLHLMKADGSWESFSFSFAPSKYPENLIVDHNDNVWMTIGSVGGGGIVVFNKSSNKSVYLTDQGGQGGMPARQVNAIAADRDGKVWVGTNQGVAYFSDPAVIFNDNVNVSRPIYDNRYLLRDEKVTALAIDGGNRKWIGTDNGVWLFDATGEKLIYNFTTQNSPLLSNHIQCIGINSISGEVFLGTDKGLASFRSDATDGQANYDQVKIFPNPVDSQFNGLVAIEGLITDSRVKITDVAGRLVWQTIANGGTASWNQLDIHGRHVDTGIYLVFSVAADGSDKNVGKIAIVE